MTMGRCDGGEDFEFEVFEIDTGVHEWGVGSSMYPTPTFLRLCQRQRCWPISLFPCFIVNTTLKLAYISEFLHKADIQNSL